MAGEMRALSVRQPWAWAIACAGKTAENRTRSTRYRGLLAIHASKTIYARDLDDPRILEAVAGKDFEIDEGPSSLGAVVAVAELTDCHDATYAEGCSCSPWANPRSWHWLLKDARPLADPVPCKGALGLWRLPDEVEKAVRAQLEDGQP